MIDEFDEWKTLSAQDLQVEVSESGDLSEVKTSLETLEDGREVVVIGDPREMRELNHRQGENEEGYEGTCGIVACEQVLRQFGVPVTEGSLVEHAIENDECVTEFETPALIQPELSGATTPTEQAQILSDFGVPAHVETGGTAEEIADAVSEGRSVILEVNAGLLWNDMTYYDWQGANHAVTVTGAARDPETGLLMGLFVNDSGTGDSGVFMDNEMLDGAWVQAGGISIITDIAV